MTGREGGGCRIAPSPACIAVAVSSDLGKWGLVVGGAMDLETADRSPVSRAGNRLNSARRSGCSAGYAPLLRGHEGSALAGIAE
jgi:hypothetical protein